MIINVREVYFCQEKGLTNASFTLLLEIHKMGKIYESTIFKTLFIRQGKDTDPIEMGLEH